eukprot:TRINITY_DN10460_c0_g1_i1.p1 TRINITY_DN10460_c0_g1~~TRINITY_DN10460_c0_g1_i1.p1  ORF type:complete len:230 (-),score=50.91 TRINITY_DN10460_c0_g1_i1:139-828(-)
MCIRDRVSTQSTWELKKMKTVVLLLILGLSLCGEFDVCFNQLRRAASNPVDLKAVSTKDIPKYLEQFDKITAIQKEIKPACQGFFKYFSQFRESLVSYGIEIATNRLARLDNYRKSLYTQLDQQNNTAETRAQIVSFFLLSTNSNLGAVVNGITSAIFYSFKSISNSLECKTKIQAAHQKSLRFVRDYEMSTYPNAPNAAVLEEALSAFEICKENYERSSSQVRRPRKL